MLDIMRWQAYRAWKRSREVELETELEADLVIAAKLRVCLSRALHMYTYEMTDPSSSSLHPGGHCSLCKTTLSRYGEVKSMPIHLHRHCFTSDACGSEVDSADRAVLWILRCLIIFLMI